MSEGQRHHVLYSRNGWTAQPTTKALRSMRWLQPAIDAESHREIHRAVASVPIPDYYMAQRVASEFVPVLNDHLASIGNLMLAFDEASRHPKAGIIERQIGQLIVQSLEIQLPLIKQGLYE